MSFADIFVTEELTGEAEENSEIPIQPPQVQVVIGEVEEPQKLLNDSSETVKELEDSSDMTLKQGDSETDQFAIESLLVNPDDLLPPVVKLEKYADSDIAFNRQVVIRNLLETLRVVQNNSDNVARVINVMCTLSEDYDPIVRSELMGQFPHIAAFCKEVGLNYTIQQYLWPILISYIGAENNQVRKASHTTLLSLVEQNLIDSGTIIDKILPLILHLTDSIHPEDLRTDAIVLMSKLSVLLGNKLTEDFFLPRIFVLCKDSSNNVRKACASAFGDISTTVGRETTEESVLSKFIELCKDTAWCVRKACAENFMTVSCVVSRETRCRELSDIYMILLKDQSRWVRVTAYQGLGPFISTFAEPDKTGLYYSKDGVLTVVDLPQPQDNTSESSNDNTCDVQCNNTNCESSEISQTPDDTDVDRTSTSEPCDSIVPLSCSENSLSASEIPGIPCHVGNYCTVIEVSCPPTTATAAKDSVVDAINDPPLENGLHDETASDAQSETDSSLDTCESTTYLNSKYLNAETDKCRRALDSCKSTTYLNSKYLNAESANLECGDENSGSKLWYEFLYGIEDSTSVVNGELSKVLKENSTECDKIQMAMTSEVESAMLNAITINGILLNVSEMLSGPLHCQDIPVVNCVNTNKQHNIDVDNSKVNLFSESISEEQDNVVISEEHENEVASNILDSGAIVESSSHPTVLVEQNDSGKGSSDESAFNHFQYWRTPIPEIDVDSVCNDLCSSNDTPDLVIGKYSPLRSVETSERFNIYNSLSNDLKQENYGELSNLNFGTKLGEYDGTSENKEGEPPPGQNSISAHDQDIVPPDLLLCYFNMIDAAWTEIAHHCAYSLPAVALTLGRKFWPCLKGTFDALSSDLQGFIMMWKVRRTVASSMHQLAVILGPEITSKDLLPVFSRFISDLDEVRIGILQHISEFLKVLHPDERKEFLPSLSEFLVSNSDTESNEKNWRFRLILAEQLVSIADLYEPQDVKDHLVPLSLTLIQDKICEVRLAAVRVMAAVMRRMSQHPTPDLTKAVLSELAERFIHSPKWLHRQLYVYICQEFIVESSLTPDQFAEDALPQLLYLCWDRVPNVRIAIARCLAVVIWPLETFSSSDSPHRELLLQTIHTLQSDLDVDVQFYANMVSTHECSCLQHGEYTNLGELPV